MFSFVTCYPALLILNLPQHCLIIATSVPCSIALWYYLPYIPINFLEIIFYTSFIGVSIHALLHTCAMQRFHFLGSYLEVKLSDAILILGDVSLGRKTLE